MTNAGHWRTSRRSIVTVAAMAARRFVVVGAPIDWLHPAMLPAGPEQGTLWVQLPNYGGAGGLAPDAFSMFTTRTDEWAEARRYVGVWVLRITSLLGEPVAVSDDFLRDAILPRLREWGIALAVNVTGATLAQCGNHPNRMDVETAAIARLIELGADISYLSLQSPLSKVGGRECPTYGREAAYDLRVADVVRYVAFMTERFPGIEIGLVDAMPAKGWAYRDVYRNLVEELRAQGLELAFIHLDFPMESATADWSNVRAAEDVIRDELGVPVGLIYVSKIGGETSNVAFRDNVLAAYRGFRDAGGRPDHLILTSWYPYPTTNLPEDDEETAPFMNLVLDFARLGGVTTRQVAAPVVAGAG